MFWFVMYVNESIEKYLPWACPFSGVKFHGTFHFQKIIFLQLLQIWSSYCFHCDTDQLWTHTQSNNKTKCFKLILLTVKNPTPHLRTFWQYDHMHQLAPGLFCVATSTQTLIGSFVWKMIQPQDVQKNEWAQCNNLTPTVANKSDLCDGASFAEWCDGAGLFQKLFSQLGNHLCWPFLTMAWSHL